MKTETLWTRTIHSPSELEGIVREVEKHLADRSIVLLEGDLGAGKTETVKTFARLRGLDEIASPSFAVHLRYAGADGVSIDHLDLYRLTDDDDLESTGFWDLFGEPQGLVFIEWADRLDHEALPRNWSLLRLRIEKGTALTERKITLEKLTRERRSTSAS